MRRHRRQVIRIPRLRVRTAKPGNSILVISSPSSEINSASNFSSALCVVVVVVAGALLVVVVAVVVVVVTADLLLPGVGCGLTGAG